MLLNTGTTVNDLQFKPEETVITDLKIKFAERAISRQHLKLWTARHFWEPVYTVYNTGDICYVIRWDLLRKCVHLLYHNCVVTTDQNERKGRLRQTKKNATDRLIHASAT